MHIQKNAVYKSIMNYLFLLFINVILFFSSFLSLNAQDTAVFRQINLQVWQKFEEAFVSNNPSLLNSLHTRDILRIPAESKTILAGKEYFDSQVKSFEWVKDNGYKTAMNVRFVERINYQSNASERGIFKFTVTEPTGEQRNYYGKFHVLLISVDGIWKISMDYDSTENGTISEKTYNEAYDMWNFKPFLSEE